MIGKANSRLSALKCKKNCVENVFLGVFFLEFVRILCAYTILCKIYTENRNKALKAFNLLVISK